MGASLRINVLTHSCAIPAYISMEWVKRIVIATVAISFIITAIGFRNHVMNSATSIEVSHYQPDLPSVGEGGACNDGDCRGLPASEMRHRMSLHEKYCLGFNDLKIDKTRLGVGDTALLIISPFVRSIAKDCKYKLRISHTENIKAEPVPAEREFYIRKEKSGPEVAWYLKAISNGNAKVTLADITHRGEEHDLLTIALSVHWWYGLNQGWIEFSTWAAILLTALLAIFALMKRTFVYRKFQFKVAKKPQKTDAAVSWSGNRFSYLPEEYFLEDFKNERNQWHDREMAIFLIYFSSPKKNISKFLSDARLVAEEKLKTLIEAYEDSAVYFMVKTSDLDFFKNKFTNTGLLSPTDEKELLSADFPVILQCKKGAAGTEIFWISDAHSLALEAPENLNQRIREALAES